MAEPKRSLVIGIPYLWLSLVGPDLTVTLAARVPELAAARSPETPDAWSPGQTAAWACTATSAERRNHHVNVPIGVVVAATRVLPETGRRAGRLDLPDAITVTAGVAALVYGLSNAATTPDGVSH